MSVIANDIATTVDTYLAMWNEEDRARREVFIEQAWTTDGSYLDPLLEAEGYGALSEMVEAVHAQYPGHRFRLTSGIDMHHEQVRFGWELAAPDGAVTVAGVDIGTIAADGRLRSITGFFGELPAA